MKKIALIGSAPSSIRLAPFKDPSWAIWSCSPGAYGVIGSERLTGDGDAHFEMHRWEPPVIGDASRQVTWFSPEYCQWMGQFKGAVWMADVTPGIPNSHRYPWEAMVDKYGPFFMNSSLSWMMAMALEQPDLEEIGLWGVDMSATEEYGYQRAGCHYFITLALQRGIRITIPPESDLLMPKPLYGVGESDPMMIKLTARMRELDGRLAGAQQRAQAAQQEIMFLSGAKDDLNYVIQTWTTAPLIDKYLQRVRSLPTAAPATAIPAAEPPRETAVAT